MEQRVERKLRGSMVLAVVFTIIFAQFSTSAVWAVPNIVRGPYLQNGTPNSVTIMWRTSENASSKVWYGTSLGTLGRSVADSGLKPDHTIWISGLSPGTKYYYQVGTTSGAVLAGGDSVHYFVTSPNPGSTGPIRIWVLGDSGRANNNARSVKNAYLELADNEKEADIWLMLGDNAYGSGTDTQYQNAVFNMYPEILRNKVLWSTRGNHEVSSTVYYGIFDFPANGEGGGLASGTEHYYSFDYANIHFICLNSQESNFSGTPGGVMYQWLEEDLANTRQKWIIAFWHHPPYSKGSHNSDTESKLIVMRQYALPILEAGGVDLVLAGHSHSYERSLFINGHYAYSSFFDPGVHVVQAGSGREDGDGAYVKLGDDGTVYIVAGSSGGVGGGSIDHPVMYFSEKQLGSLIIDVQGSRMDVRFLRETTNPIQVDDYFTIQDTFLTAMFVGPADGLTDVSPRDVVLRWTPGEYASKHDVYFGTNFDDVKEATATVDPGGVYLARQDPNYYPISGALDLGETYYWRVDEVNGPPDFTVFEGEVWSFTTEPFSYPVENITATASSAHQADMGPENTINGLGLDADDLHSIELADMWLSSDEPNGAWIEYELDKVHKLHEMWVWNHNGTMEPTIGLGFKDVTIEYSVNGTDYTTLGTTHEFARAPGTPNYAHNTTIDFSGVAAKYVRLTANSNWGGFMDQYGLSEVRFLYIPVRAREPHPESDTTDVAVDVTLGFRAGREAANHNVYLSTDEQAVIDGTAPVSTVTGNSYSTSLDVDSTYYWRVDEVNDAETPTTWQSDIWNFTTHEFFIVDDFEDYNKYPPDEIWSTWLDGHGAPTNGATVGYPNPNWNQGELYVETTIVHGGEQAMPFFYSNTGAAAYSEGERTFAVPQDWTKAGVQTLALYFHGTAGNTGQLYVKVNGSKVVYDGDASNLARTRWQAWNIELASFGTNLQSVTTLAIGIDGSGAGGTLYFDDIRLYARSP
ncbi:MAG: metallophosphoesterase [Planctomycetes bacterium]|nr:metallophosphoesterase [Planctomycetota bacterium]